MTEQITKAAISDDELADICDRNRCPSVRDKLASGQTQAQATAYLRGLPILAPDAPDDADGFYDDGEGHWLKHYIEGALCAACDHRWDAHDDIGCNECGCGGFLDIDEPDAQ